jgi:hypothetical protein
MDKRWWYWGLTSHSRDGGMTIAAGPYDDEWAAQERDHMTGLYEVIDLGPNLFMRIARHDNASWRWLVFVRRIADE